MTHLAGQELRVPQHVLEEQDVGLDAADVELVQRALRACVRACMRVRLRVLEHVRRVCACVCACAGDSMHRQRVRHAFMRT